MLKDFATAYLDDILVYLKGIKEDYTAKVKYILRMLREVGLSVNLKKYEFSAKIVKYLSYIV